LPSSGFYGPGKDLTEADALTIHLDATHLDCWCLHLHNHPIFMPNALSTATITIYPGLGQAHTHPFNGPFSGTTRVGWYQKGKTNLDFTEARDSE